MLTSRGGEAAFAFFSDVSNVVDNDMQFNMYTVAETVLATIDSTVTTTVAPCSGTTASAQTTCANTFVSAFAQKAYRRPLDSSEVTNLMKVYAQGAMQDYKTGIELMIEAVIISPSFVYRTELGAPSTADASGNYPATTLTPYEVASQLSFTLLGTLPDAALTTAASNGSLATTSGIQTQINRLLALPAVQANLTNIVLGWFNIGQMFSKTKDTSLIASLSTSEQDLTGIENDLFTSTQNFVNSILWSGSGKIDDLLTSQTVYVNQRLATLYPGVTYATGVKAPTSDTTFVAATWPASQGRSGMLTQPSLPLVRLRSVGQFNREAGQGSPRLRHVPGSARRAGRPVDAIGAAGPRLHQSQRPQRHAGLDLRQRDPACRTPAWPTSPARAATPRWIPIRGSCRTSVPSATTARWTKRAGPSIRR